MKGRGNGSAGSGAPGLTQFVVQPGGEGWPERFAASLARLRLAPPSLLLYTLPASGFGMVEGVVSSLILATVIVLVAVDLWFGSAQHWCTSTRPIRNENVGAGNIETGA